MAKSLSNVNIFLLTCLLFVIINLISSQKSTVYIPEHTEDEELFEPIHKPDIIDNEKDIPKIEVITNKKSSQSSFISRLIIYFPLAFFILNLAWGTRTNDKIISEWLENFKKNVFDRFSTEEKNPTLTFIDTDNDKKIMFLTATQPVCCYSFEMKLLNRSDIFTSIWNKIHGYSDTIEITGYLSANSVERFTLFFGKRSFLSSNNEFNKMKTFCQEFSSGANERLPAYIATLTEGPEIASSIIKAELIDEIVTQIDHFNYFYVTDVVNKKIIASHHIPLLNPESSYITFKISLTLTSPKMWNYKLNNLDGLMTQFATLLQTASSVRLSKETKQNIERSRVKLAELRVKEDHQQRQENAMKKKDEKVRQLKDKIRTEPDSEKQLKLQEKFQKQEIKEKNKKISKGKSLKLIA